MEKQQNSATESITESALEVTSESERQEAIAALAYQLWQARGCPDGSPEEDWFRADREIAGLERIYKEEVANRDFAQQSVDAEEAQSPELRFPIRSKVFQPPIRGLREQLNALSRGLF